MSKLKDSTRNAETARALLIAGSNCHSLAHGEMVSQDLVRAGAMQEAAGKDL